jgi:hypothetical protein
MFYSIVHSFIFLSQCSISYLRLLPPYYLPLPHLLFPSFPPFLFEVKTTTKCSLRFPFCSRLGLAYLFILQLSERRKDAELKINKHG